MRTIAESIYNRGMRVNTLMNNTEIAELLRAVAAAYELHNADKNKFKIIAYERAADAVEHASSELKDLWDEGKLEDVPGIGKSIAEHLSELFSTGKSKHFEQVMQGLPKQMFDLMIVPGIGVKTAYKLVNKFKSKFKKRKAIKVLEYLAKKGEISKLEGFGEESELDILRSIKEVKGRTVRHLLPYANEIADRVIDWMKKNKNVINIDPLGSLRRKASTVGDIDISVGTTEPKDVIDHFVNFPTKQRILEKGNHTASLILPGNIQVDLMVQSPDSYGSLLQHFTGSKHHNIALREYARSLNPSLSLSEYGIKVIKGKRQEMKEFSDEKSFYNFLGMEWIPPELREDGGEIEAAMLHKVPNLIEISDVRGDLQIHSDFDIETSHDLGLSSMNDIVDKANQIGYQYIAFTEHNPSHSRHSENQIIDILKRKRETVDKVNRSLSSRKSLRKVYNSLEIDILPDGNLPVPDKGLETLDFALVSIHSSFRLDKKIMTTRVLSALANPKVKIFAHPTARKINGRESIELDWGKIFDYCKNNNKWLEVNADPMRLDLPDFLVREAVKNKVKITFGTDAHHIDHMTNMRYAVFVARRGWAEKKDSINTRGLSDFEKLLKW